MKRESNPKSASQPNFENIILGILIGSLITMATMLIYMNYLDQTTSFLLYVSLIFFGVVVVTFILVWGFKTYLTRLIFGSKVADSPDLIAEAQQMADQLSSSVIDKLLEKATDEDKEKVKGLVVRLGNWFLWGRLRNWWWSWILGIFVSLGGLTGTLLLVNQNELLQNQNNLVANQTELLSKQNKLIENQMSLEDASRRGSLVVLMSNIFDKVDDEIALQRAEIIKRGKKVTDDTKFKISQSLIGQIAALSHAFKPYRFMDGDTLIRRPLSPERGQLLVTITRLPLDTITMKKIFSQSIFNYSYLVEANLNKSYLVGISLDYADLSLSDLEMTNFREAHILGAELLGADLGQANLKGAILAASNLGGANLYEANLSNAILAETSLIGTNLEYANLAYADIITSNLTEAVLIGAVLTNANLFGSNLMEANLENADFRHSDLREVQNLTFEQISISTSLYKCKLPSGINSVKLKLEYPKLFF